MPPKLEFLWLTTAETQAAEAFLAARDSAPAKAAFLAAYRWTLRDLKETSGSPLVPVLLRAWEMSRAALVAGLSSAEVRAGVGLAEAKTPPAYHRQARMDQPLEGWGLATPATFDADVRQALRAVKTGSGGSYADFLARWVRYIVIVDDKRRLDPTLPLGYEGTVDPLVGTAIVPKADEITGQRGPSWRIAAALVHEAEHVRWYYQVAGTDARLLLPAPDERNSYRGMFLFLREARRVAGQTRPAEASDLAALSADMAGWRDVVRQTNALLGYSEDDLSDRRDLTVSDEALLTPITGSHRE